MKSSVVKRSIIISGHKTSVSLEDAFWSELKQIASRCNRTLSAMVATIDTERPTTICHPPFAFSCLITVADYARRRNSADDHGAMTTLITHEINRAWTIGIVGELRETHEADHVLVKLKVRGRGIDPGDIDRIFDAFFTTKPTG